MDSNKAVKKNYSKLTISDIFKSIQKYKLLVILIVAISIIAGIISQNVFTGNDPKINYYTKATMIVTSKTADGSYQISGNEDNPSWSDVNFAQSLVLTVTELAKSNYVLNLVIDKIGETNLTPNLLRDFISCNEIERTAFIEVTITWLDENESIMIVNALMDVLPQAMIEKLDIGSVTVVDYATTTPKNILGILYIIIFTAVGTIIGLSSAIILGLLNVKVYSAEDINKYLKLDTISELPYCNKSKNNSRLFSDPMCSIEYRESCSVLSSVFQYISIKKSIKVIYVTSAVSGEGKTTTSINLSMALANKDKDVVLIDCDTRRPSVDESLGQYKYHSSLQDVLAGKADINDALINHIDNMMILRSDINETPLNTNAFADMLSAMRERYDYIIIDTPPIGLLSDALLLNFCVDGVLFVIKHDYADMGLIADSINSIKDSGAEIIGCVLNAKKKIVTNNYYSKNRYYKKYNSNYLKKDSKKSYLSKEEGIPVAK
ncbi:MAG: polysaccharide biosynthesis tyrosine autokinase [Eubacteriales bacterium]